MSDAQAIDRRPHAATGLPREAKRRVRRRYARRPAAAGLWHRRHRARHRPARHPARLARDQRLPGLRANQGRPRDLRRSGEGRCQGPGQGQLSRCSCAMLSRASSRPMRPTSRSPMLTEDPDLRRAVSSCATTWSRIPTRSARRITLRIPVSDPFDQLNKGVIPKEVDALTWSQVRWFERLAEPRCGGGGRAAAPSLKLEVYHRPSQDRGRASAEPAISPPWRGTACKPICPTSTIPASSPCWPMTPQTPSPSSGDGRSGADRQDGADPASRVSPALCELAKGETPEGAQSALLGSADRGLRHPGGERARAHAVQLGAVLQRRQPLPGARRARRRDHRHLLHAARLLRAELSRSASPPRSISRSSRPRTG